MEYVSFGEGEGDPADGTDNGLGQMSEKVQAMAQSIYLELETLVKTFGPASAQSITPILVRMLENLDEEIKHRRETQTELELAKADREQLLNHYEREREVFTFMLVTHETVASDRLRRQTENRRVLFYIKIRKDREYLYCL